MQDIPHHGLIISIFQSYLQSYFLHRLNSLEFTGYFIGFGKIVVSYNYLTFENFRILLLWKIDIHHAFTPCSG